MTLLDHLIELRRRLIYCLVGFVVSTGGCYFVAEDIFGFLTRPLVQILGGQHQRHMIYTGLTEAFSSYVKLAMFGGLFVSFPFIAIQAWLFIAPGLFEREKKVFAPFLIATPFLFLAGAALAYTVIIPMAWGFFLSFETTGLSGAMPIRFEAKVNEYLHTVMQVIFAFGLCFQLPVVLALLARIGVVTVSQLVRMRKYAFLFIVIGAAILTPPDFLSPFGLIIPLVILYELSILLIKWMGPGVSKDVSSPAEMN